MKALKTFLSLSFLVFALSVVTGCASNGKTDKAKKSANTEAVNQYSVDWLDSSVPALKDVYADYFDKMGVAVEYGIHGYKQRELNEYEVQCGVEKHFSSITMGNEFKPQFVFQWWGGNPALSGEKFTASNGVTIETPVIKGFATVDAVLNICKAYGYQMRGHVLVWHSQTDDQFFYEGYNPQTGKLVDKETMTARQEWYIKTLIEHVQNWEQKYNKGKQIIWAWDVVNEAVSDGGSGLRNQGSKWYDIYGNDEFIVNAFRFANKYVNPDVVLCYNDYGCVSPAKRAGMIKVLKDVQAAQNDAVLPTRINAMGMQSHISVNTSVSSFEKAIQDFLALGLDVQITELDVATESFYNPRILATKYYDLFTMFLENRKVDGANGISTITIWGINDEITWLNSEDQKKYHGNVDQFPLLFELDENKKYVTKEAYWSVLKAAEDFKNK